MLARPLSIYINWASYDELSDAVELTEILAMRQMDELLRLRALGVRFDSYLMDAFWYEPDSAYRRWRQPHWPQGPDRWLAACREHGLKPGLWFSGNTLCKLKIAPAWRDSVDADSAWRGLCMFHGGFMPDFLGTLRYWYGRGIRVFKLDFFNLNAAPEAVRRCVLPSEIRARNVEALRQGLGAFRRDCPEAVILGYNGLEEAPTQDATDRPFCKTVDARWLDVFDSLYCGDPRPADVPAMDFWRSKDIYTDHLVSVYERNGFPLARIDNAGFMIGNTGTCYFRRTAGWKAMLILSLARGGRINTYYGNLELLDRAQGEWFARVQNLFTSLQQTGEITRIGGIPGEARPYGYRAGNQEGYLYAVVNPAQAVEKIALPGLTSGRVLFRDAGYVPAFDGENLSLGPEQMALVGSGRFEKEPFDLGAQEDVVIPSSIAPMAVAAGETEPKRSSVSFIPPDEGSVRVVMRQRDREGLARRSKGGAPPSGITMGRLLVIEAAQRGRPVEVKINYDKAIWSGLSWAVAEIEVESLQRGVPVTVQCSTREEADVHLDVSVYAVSKR